MASGSQNNTTYQAQKWTNLRAFTIGDTAKNVDGTAAVSWSKDEILGASTDAYFLRGDKVWSNTLNGVLLLPKGLKTGSRVSDSGSGIVIDNDGGIEIFHTSTPFIDFHYQASTADYSVRLMCDSATNIHDSGSFTAGKYITAGTYVYASTYLQAKTHVYSDTGHFYMKYNNTWYSVLHNHGNGNISVEAASGGLYIGYSNTTLVNWMNGRMQLKNGCLSIFPNSGDYREGIRIHSVGSWSDITLCGNDNTGDSGTSANSWFIGNNNGNFYIARNGSPGGTAYIGCVSNVWKFVTAADIPEGAANLSAAATAHTLSIYRNGITIPYQMDNANDGGMLRVRGTTESNCILELGTWDDSGAGETIQFNYYPTTSQVTPTYSISVPKHSGTLVTTDGHGASGSWGISVTGSSASCTGNAATATKATQDGSGNVITSKYVTIDTAQTITGTKSWGTSGAGGQLNGAATDGGINSIRIGNDVWLGDCNAGGIMGMKSTGANTGFYFYNSSGTNTGQFYTNGTNFVCNKPISRAGVSRSWINGRDTAIIRTTSYDGYDAITSMKTTDGAWEMGVYTDNIMYFVYTPDAKYNSGTNNGYTSINIRPNGHLYAAGLHGPLTGDVTGNCSGSAGSVAWSGVSGKPATATRWPSWSEVTSKPAVQNNLTSTSTTDMLSAAQGKALNDNKTAKGTGLAYTTLLNQTYAGTSYKTITVSNISSYNALFFACYYWSWWRGSMLIPISEFKSHGVTIFFMIGSQTPEYANFKYVSDTSIQISTDHEHELVFKVWGAKTS